jgi:tyrosine-protein kinase
LGEGEFGSVLRGVYKAPDGTRQEVAVKTLHDENGTREEAFLEEARLMMRLNHPCVVRLLGVVRGHPLLMVQELVPLGSVLNFLLTTPHLASPQHELRLWAAQIACGKYNLFALLITCIHYYNVTSNFVCLGMQYLESERFVHRDLAARNILLLARHQAKISDFGLSRALGNNEYYRASQGGRWPIKW